jgi:hypothetical protein
LRLTFESGNKRRVRPLRGINDPTSLAVGSLISRSADPPATEPKEGNLALDRCCQSTGAANRCSFHLMLGLGDEKTANVKVLRGTLKLLWQGSRCWTLTNNLSDGNGGNDPDQRQCQRQWNAHGAQPVVHL